MAVVSLTGVLTMMITVYSSFNYGFLNYLRDRENTQLQRMAPELRAYYEEAGSWNRLKHSPRVWHGMIRQAHHETPPLDPAQVEAFRQHIVVDGKHARQQHENIRPLLARQFAARIYLLDADRQMVIGRRPTELNDDELLPVRLNGATIGWLGLVRLMDVHTSLERNFLRHAGHALIVSSVVGLVMAIFISWWLARHLSGPVKALANATGRIRGGDLSTRVETRGQGEIGELASDFNAMVSSLQHNENARRQWMSDIAHELRTPLSIMRGEVEAMQDGLRELDQDSLSSLHSEIDQLGALVEDLRYLSLADQDALPCHMERVNPSALISDMVRTYSPRFISAGIELTWRPDQSKSQENSDIFIQGDSKRLRQLLHNLLENSLRYTHGNGRCQIQLRQSMNHKPESVEIIISDSAPGVPDAALPRLFDRLYRVDSSRNRQRGGSGLGLAIVKSIVEAHGGTIQASHSSDGGLQLSIKLPLDGGRTLRTAHRPDEHNA